ncbi:thymidine phosphorylase [Nocardia abscessus]|uniref:Thymidine phosphorylase n=1 Tax=Nocardia abscessus TaxID=120957 RepID=A0ABS0C9S4_9NOCA|nr:thymidine phosphorylase [Nocardia abscessus]MBF6227116.1 thymidine phosphorylase [Nocardia abscessus]
MNSAATLLQQRRARGIEFTQEQFAALLAPGTPDAVVAALLTTLAMSGHSDSEAAALTQAYVASGRQVTWPDATQVVDKHSTGCVGDDVSIVLAPLLAANGLRVAKITGSALRHCGGTLDKLRCIPGLRLDLTVAEFVGCVETVGFCVAGQSPELVPADGRTYALRERTGTVDVAALIAASIMSKKLATGAATIALEVKYGPGALVATEADADELVRLMRAIGESAGRRMLMSTCDASQPLAPAAGPLLELREAVAVLRGGGSLVLREHVTGLAEQILHAVPAPDSAKPARTRVDDALNSGGAYEMFCHYVDHLGGNVEWLDNSLETTRASTVVTSYALRAAVYMGIDARPVGEAAQTLAALDATCGVRILAEPGQPVSAGQPVLEIHAPDLVSGHAHADVLGRHCHFHD